MIDFKVFYLQENEGHGNARRKGFCECKNDIVALMDSDDISVPSRFEKQIMYLERHPELSVLGGQIAEFVGNVENIVGIRKVPVEDSEIKKYMKKRCPMNQVSVILRKSEMERVGGYIDWYCEEDYYLWARMALGGCVFGNLPDVLVNVRIGNEMSARRGGMKYFRSEARMQKFLYHNHIIGIFRYMYNVCIRFVGEVLSPNFIRAKLFTLFRDSNNEEVERKENAVKGASDICGAVPFSVAMCVYAGDRAEWFDEALDSIMKQTLKPQEIVLVVDGPIPNSIQTVIDKYVRICNE